MKTIGQKAHPSAAQPGYIPKGGYTRKAPVVTGALEGGGYGTGQIRIEIQIFVGKAKAELITGKADAELLTSYVLPPQNPVMDYLK